MTSLVTCDQLVPSLTSALATATPAQLAALSAALLPGVGVGGFVSASTGTNLPSGTAVTLATWTAPRAGKIAVSFNYLAVLPAGVDGTGAARITQNGSIVAAATSRRHHDVAFAAPTVSRNYLEVAAGDVISGVAAVDTVGAVASTSDNLGFPNASGLSIHYFA